RAEVGAGAGGVLVGGQITFQLTGQYWGIARYWSDGSEYAGFVGAAGAGGRWKASTLEELYHGQG
ncbi:hypothetical protein M1B34_33655, partial [Pseudomonas sp. MAFF 302030]